MTVALLAFTMVTGEKLREPEMLGCGTSDDDVVKLNKYEVPLEHPGLQLFQSNCKSCHRLDQKLVGPPLRNSFETRDSVWFAQMIVDAKGLIDSGDTLAIRLFNDFNQTQHPRFKGFDKKELAALIEYLKLEGRRDNWEQ